MVERFSFSSNIARNSRHFMEALHHFSTKSFDILQVHSPIVYLSIVGLPPSQLNMLASNCSFESDFIHFLAYSLESEIQLIEVKTFDALQHSFSNIAYLHGQKFSV